MDSHLRQIEDESAATEDETGMPSRKSKLVKELDETLKKKFQLAQAQTTKIDLSLAPAEHLAEAKAETQSLDGDFVERFLKRVPRHIGDSFTEQQLSAIKMAFGARQFGNHSVDLRKTFQIFGRRYYFVALFGHEKRRKKKADLSIRRWAIYRFAGAVWFSLAVVALLVAILGGLYALKIFLGINLLQGLDTLPDGMLTRHLKALFE